MFKSLLIKGSILIWIFASSGLVGSENRLESLQVSQIMRVPRIHNIVIKGTFEEGKTFTWIEQRELRAGRGDSVVFINESQANIKLRFGEGSSCEEVPKKSLDWRLRPNRCFETKDLLESREALNLRFREIGQYPYTVEFVDKNRVERGVIFIRTEDR